MRRVKSPRFPFVAGLAAALLVNGVYAQQPTSTPIVVQAANAASTPVAAKPVVQENTGSAQATIKALEQAKAANDEILKKQEATLQQLDDLQKAAEQLKIFAKRG